MWTGRKHLNEDRLITCLRRQAGKVHDKEKRLRQAGMEWMAVGGKVDKDRARID